MKLVSPLFQASNFKVRQKEDLELFARKSGVYRIYNQQAQLLYVGKAKDLKARVQYYFKDYYDNPRIQQLVAQRWEIVITLTQGEAQALWLEQNYIHFEQPKYNVILLDDRSYPWICLTAEQYPRLRIHRGERNKHSGKYFGPFSSARAAHMTLRLIKQLFYLRQCRGLSQSTAKRPCLDHHLGYCSGPCFKGMKVDVEAYQKNIREVEEFLNGKTQKVVERLALKMRESSQRQDYARALHYREQICAVQQLTDRQGVQMMRTEDTDLLACVSKGSWACIYQLIVRDGGVVGGHAHFLKNGEIFSEEELFWQFISQFYFDPADEQLILDKETLKQRCWPSCLILPLTCEKIKLMQAALKLAKIPKLQLEPVGRSSEKNRLYDLALLNAQQALQGELAFGTRRSELFQTMETIFGIPSLEKIDCIDISHLQGTSMIGAVVRFTHQGLSYSDYRKYHLKEFQRSNDCEAIAQTMRMHYKKRDLENLPELLVIDGGKAQFLAAQKTLEELKEVNPHLDQMVIISLAKGKQRRSGWEQVWTKNGPIPFDRDKLWALLEVRDAVHHYAIRQHRRQRSKTFLLNSIEALSGIGPKRYQALLEFTGGIGKLKGASLEQIKAVPGISHQLAQRIWDTLHTSSKGVE